MKLLNVPSPRQAKEALFNAMVCGPAGRVPYFEISFSRNHLAMMLGDHVLRDYPKGPLPVGRRPPEWAVQVAVELGTGFVHGGYVWELGRIYETDAQGNATYAGGSIRSTDDLRSAPPVPTEAVLERVDRFLGLTRQHDLAFGWEPYGPMVIAQSAMGLEHFCIALHENRDLIKALLDAAVEAYVPLIEKVVEAGIDFLLVGDTLCFNSGPIIDPDLLRELWLPAMETYLKPARQREIPIGLHTDGNNAVFLDDFIDLGFKFIHPVEPCGGAFDIYETQKRVKGRLALCGNIDLSGVLSRGTPEEVRQDVAEHIARLGPAGGYLCGSSHEISDSVPPENFEAMVQAVHDFGRTYAEHNKQ